jgi:hypothetical protein
VHLVYGVCSVLGAFGKRAVVIATNGWLDGCLDGWLGSYGMGDASVSLRSALVTGDCERAELISGEGGEWRGEIEHPIRLHQLITTSNPLSVC